MKRFKHLVLGGIEQKVFNLILATVILLAGAFFAVSLRHNNMLTDLAAESSARQQTAITDITNSVMTSVVEQSMSRATELEAYIADEMFRGLESRVSMLGEYARKLFAGPEAHPRAAWSAPDPRDNGKAAAQLLLAEGVDASDPALRDRIGLAANMSDLMVALFGASKETNSCFIALPDGVFLIADDRSAAKFNDAGEAISYDPRTRPWYRLAVEQKGLIFTDVETDAFTGGIGIVGAMPVYVDGQLAAVVGSDLFLTSMQTAVQASLDSGAFVCVVNQNGHVVFSPMTEGVFRVLPAQTAADLRQSENAGLAALVNDALNGWSGMRLVTLDEGPVYLYVSPLDTVGWTLISVCPLEAVEKPAGMLQESYAQIEGEITSSYRSRTDRSRDTTYVMLIGITLVMGAAALILGKRIVKPLNTITRRISELDESNPEFRMEDAYRTGDEIEELASSFAALSHKTVEYVEKVRTVTAEKERISTELSLATTIQSAMMPHIFPAFPDRSDFDIFASMDPAKEVGGDFYDYFLIDNDHLCMIMADVSGKGVPGALFMMASKIILQSCAMLGHSAADILAKTNQAICSNNEAQMFVTVWLGILELSTGRLCAANAGHEYPVLKRPDGQFEILKDKHGFVLGGLEETRYREYHLQLEPGTKLFVYTDGLPEATDAQSRMFGTGRMLDALNAQPDAAPQRILENVKAAVDGFVKDAPQFDDLTMLCMEYKGKKGLPVSGK